MRGRVEMERGVIEPFARAFDLRRIRPKVAPAIRDLMGLPRVLARAGALEARLATTRREIRQAQRLRYEVFFEQGAAVADRASSWLRRDKCAFDRTCDHLIVVDTTRALRDEGIVVGTYRLLRDDVASRHTGFYSATAFDLAPLLRRHRYKRFLELGRSCVHPAYRSRRVIDLLWQGIGLYAGHHGTDVLIGCSSLDGTEAESLAMPLGFAFHHAAAAACWQVEPVAWRATRMDWIEKTAVDARRGLATLPPLMKAYVRAGGAFASSAAVDRQFGTTDLFTVLPLAEANPRYLAHFGSPPREAA